jgi:hypothetical protein
MGETGSGKSVGIRTLDPASTFLINVEKKELPFRSNGYVSVDSGPPKEGNLLESDDFGLISKTIDYISEKRTDINTIVIDDFQYIFANNFMRRVKEKSFDKFNDIAHIIWSLGRKTKDIRSDLIVFILTHSEMEGGDSDPFTRVKTMGKLVNKAITFEGLFTTVLLAKPRLSKDNKMEYSYMTHSDGANTVKSPIDMFEEDFIPNDLNLVRTKYIEYYGN